MRLYHLIGSQRTKRRNVFKIGAALAAVSYWNVNDLRLRMSRRGLCFQYRTYRRFYLIPIEYQRIKHDQQRIVSRMQVSNTGNPE